MLISDFDYQLTEQLIAQNPLRNRESSRMLFADRNTNVIHDQSFPDLVDILENGDVLVLNNTKVFPARLFGVSETGAKIELFLIERIAEQTWETLARPAKRLKIGRRIDFGEKLSAKIIEKTDRGRVVAEFDFAGDFGEILDEVGKTPLPPYIKRDESNPSDRERYQTVYAKKLGAIAAPTAGLHFTPEVLEMIKNAGVAVVEITLHVGYGTFEPVRVSDLSEHSVLPEKFHIDQNSADILNSAKSKKSRIIAVGTTTTRALETSFSANGEFISGDQVADLTITPGYKFCAIDGLLTNFHLPRSSLLVLVSTFGGYDFIMKIYKHAVKKEYRFYSYGDCMIII